MTGFQSFCAELAPLSCARRRRLSFDYLRVGVLHALLGIYDRGNGRRDDHAANGGGVRFDRLEDARRANDSRVEEILLGVGDVEMERRGRVDDGLERRVRDDDFVECWCGVSVLVGGEGRALRTAFLGDVFDDGKVELRGGMPRVGLPDLVRLFLTSHGRHDRMAALQEIPENMGGNEAGATYSSYQYRLFHNRELRHWPESLTC